MVLNGSWLCTAEGSGVRPTADTRWIPNTHYGSASPLGHVTARTCGGLKQCSAPKTSATAGCRSGHAVCCKPVADLV